MNLLPRNTRWRVVVNHDLSRLWDRAELLNLSVLKGESKSIALNDHDVAEDVKEEHDLLIPRHVIFSLAIKCGMFDNWLEPSPRTTGWTQPAEYSKRYAPLHLAISQIILSRARFGLFFEMHLVRSSSFCFLAVCRGDHETAIAKNDDECGKTNKYRKKLLRRALYGCESQWRFDVHRFENHRPF